MKIDMGYPIINYVRRTLLSILFVLTTLGLAGCSGGMIGTGTGPTIQPNAAYQLTTLPDRISPDIPKTMLRGEQLTPPELENNEAIEKNLGVTARMDEAIEQKSSTWQKANQALVDASLTRANAEINSTIIDIAFNDILNLCADQLIDCRIPSDRIRVKLTQNVINRLTQIVIDLVESLPRDFFSDELRLDWSTVTREQFTSLLDSEVVLGETHYSRLDGAPYDHSVQTDIKRKTASDLTFAALVWQDETFDVRWRNDGSVARFVLQAVDEYAPVQDYFYQNNAPSEMLVARNTYSVDNEPYIFDESVKVVANKPDNAGVLVEFATGGIVSISVDQTLPILGYDQGLLQAQMDNGGGYATFDSSFFDITDTSRLFGYAGRRDSFDHVGTLISATGCQQENFTQGIEVCSEDEFVSIGPIGNSITDSPYYFPMDEFDSLVALHDAIRWTVEGLPAGLKGFEVISADLATELSDREVLCRGFQISSDDIRVFCSATDEQLDNTVVRALVEGRPGNIIPEATLVQIP